MCSIPEGQISAEWMAEMEKLAIATPDDQLRDVFPWWPAKLKPAEPLPMMPSMTEDKIASRRRRASSRRRRASEQRRFDKLKWWLEDLHQSEIDKFYHTPHSDDSMAWYLDQLGDA